MTQHTVRTAKAVVIRETGKAVSVERIEVGAPRIGEITVRMAACSSRSPDRSVATSSTRMPGAGRDSASASSAGSSCRCGMR